MISAKSESPSNFPDLSLLMVHNTSDGTTDKRGLESTSGKDTFKSLQISNNSSLSLLNK